MRIIAKIGDDEGIVRKASGVQIGGQLSERHEVGQLLGIVLHVGEIGERIMADGVAPRVVTDVADRWNILSVRLPGFACGEEAADDVVCVDGESARRDGSVSVRGARVCPVVSSK